MSSSQLLTASDLEDKTATLTLDGAEEADRWLRDNGKRHFKFCHGHCYLISFSALIRSLANE